MLVFQNRTICLFGFLHHITVAGEQLCGACRLRNEHIQSTCRTYLSCAGIGYKLCPQRIVYCIDNTLKRTETVNIKRSTVFIRIHADRSRVYNDLNICFYRFKLIVAYIPVGMRISGNTDDTACSERFRYRAGGFGCSTSTEHRDKAFFNSY